jgi:hypothetical protein
MKLSLNESLLSFNNLFFIFCFQLFALVGFVVIASAYGQARRVKLRPRPAATLEQDDQIQYYEAEPRAIDEELVLVNPANELSLYGRQQASARQDNYIRNQPSTKTSRTKESTKEPPVQTIRNYNKVNDDGSFTFGYEAADGSFKEETRGTDCVVRGKYGYIDPDGNKREFTYVSGNPCDPNDPSGEDDDKSKEESNEASDEPANYPVRLPRPVARPTPRPIQTTSRPSTTVFQNTYNQHEIDADEDEIPVTRPPRPVSSPVAITPRPPPATTFRPQLLTITQRPHVTQRPASPIFNNIIPSTIPTTQSPFVHSDQVVELILPPSLPNSNKRTMSFPQLHLLSEPKPNQTNPGLPVETLFILHNLFTTLQAETTTPNYSRASLKVMEISH